jgi:hypothetical protein
MVALVVPSFLLLYEKRKEDKWLPLFMAMSSRTKKTRMMAKPMMK